MEAGAPRRPPLHEGSVRLRRELQQEEQPVPEPLERTEVVPQLVVRELWERQLLLLPDQLGVDQPALRLRNPTHVPKLVQALFDE